MPADFFGELRTSRARKPYRCEWCNTQIHKGETHVRNSARWDGMFQCWRMHEDCFDDMQLNTKYDEEFIPFGNERPRAGAIVLRRHVEESILAIRIGTWRILF